MTSATSHRAATTLLVLLSATASCSSYQPFLPAEQTLTQTPGGAIAAIYDLRVANQRWGDIRVWSNGAETREIQGQERTVVHVGFETRNTSAHPLALDLAHSQLEAVKAGAKAIAAIPPSTTTGEPQTPAHSVGRVDFEFVMPSGVTPSDLESFRVHWWLHGPGELVYEQFTDFVPQRTYYYRSYYPYQPWFFGPGFYWCAPLL